MSEPPGSDLNPAAAVSLRGISKFFDDVTAVDHVDLEIGDGEFFALLGPSGCGKTTTLRMIGGLEIPSEGSLRIFGDEVGPLPPNKRPVNTVFQNYALFPHMSVADNVAFGLRMRKVDRAETASRVAQAISLVRMAGMENRRPAQLSGGQQQRVALARALVNRPKVLLLDEPLAALDLKLRQEMQFELKQLQREVGITFVFVTHDQEEALALSDRIGVMNEGRLLQVGTPEEMYDAPVDRFVADFIGRSNFLAGTLEDVSTVCLANGTRIRVPAVDAEIAAPGSAIQVSLRPERVMIADESAAPEGAASLSGRVSAVTFLGNSIVYHVGLDWMTVEVETDHRPDLRRHAVGDDVVLWWRDDAIAVVRP
ncbi:MAG: ABC transporter ATP-binding protein [Actinomycetota bacterium]|nr:ABC transporter ATP-binding protein [Actinomycetota bacterium]MDA3014617.1 ABC transporter ATP-binding protein [Actinomycetota bacterium]MDA3027286.1 ABC transporter ATP-binding protein [Actinomycetota bacterium]